RFTMHNAEIGGQTRLQLASATNFSGDSDLQLRRVSSQERPDVVHCHNTHPLLPPACLLSDASVGVPVVQSLHNYRLLCPNANFYRDGSVCEKCIGHRVPYPGVIHGCYRGSRTATALLAASLMVHRSLDTWFRCVDVFLALSEFSRGKFVQGG